MKPSRLHSNKTVCLLRYNHQINELKWLPLIYFTMCFCILPIICCHLKERRSLENLLIVLRRKSQFVAVCCSGYHYWTTSFNEACTHVLRRFKPCSRHAGDLRWGGSLKMFPAGNKAKPLSSVNHTIKTIHQKLQCSSNYVSGTHEEPCEIDFVCKVSINWLKVIKCFLF